MEDSSCSPEGDDPDWENPGNDPDDDSTLQLPSDLPDPEEDLIRKQKASLLKTVVNQLKPRYSKLVKLRYYQEYSYEEIAKELNLPLGTVKAQLFRAKELLYNILKHRNV